MGSFGVEEDYEGASMVEGDESAMAGVLYDNADANMTEEERRRLSMPSIRTTQHIAGQAGQDGVAHSNTYPPPGARPAGGLHPPNIDRGSTSSATSPSLQNSHTPHTSISSMPLSAGSASVFSQSGMTESPKPLSPGAGQVSQGGQKRAASQQSGSGLSMPSHGMSQAAAWRTQYPPANGSKNEANAGAAAAAGRGRGRGIGGAAPRQVSNGAGGEASGSVSEATLMAYIRHLDDKITKMAAELEARNQRDAQLMAKAGQQEQREAQLAAKVSELEQHVVLLTGQVDELRAALQPQAAETPQENAVADQQ